MAAQILWATASAIIAVMGLLHLRGTLGSDKVGPGEGKLKEDMKAAPLLLTNKLNMWDCWVGFNATHSSGAIFIGAANFYLALKHFTWLQADHFLPLLTIAAAAFYVWVAATYWFKTVLVLLCAACSCFIIAYLLMLAA